jgi:molecular chaperone DnaK
MKRTMDILQTAQHKAAETMYRSASAPGAGGAAGGGPQPGDEPAGGAAPAGDDVIDAEVVEEEKK